MDRLTVWQSIDAHTRVDMEAVHAPDLGPISPVRGKEELMDV